jgi:hypothetical protein
MQDQRPSCSPSRGTTRFAVLVTDDPAARNDPLAAGKCRLLSSLSYEQRSEVENTGLFRLSRRGDRDDRRMHWPRWSGFMRGMSGLRCALELQPACRRG